MKVWIIGYGKMGKEIHRQLTERGYPEPFISERLTPEILANPEITSCEVAIEFTHPEAAVHNYLQIFSTGIPLVSGTTGWLNQEDKILKAREEFDSGFFYASNFSPGMYLFRKMHRELARQMNRFPQYEVSMEESHHLQKQDAPSGTAISLAQDLLDELDSKNSWVCNQPAQAHQIPITAHRIGEVPGTHQVRYESAFDDISIQHDAKSRAGFAWGAIEAALFMRGKKGFFTLENLYGEK